MYRIDVSRNAEKDLEKLPKVALKKIEATIDGLAEDPRPRGCIKLKGTVENLWRVRAGNYRVIYLIDDEVRIIDVRRVRDRKDVYDLM